MIIEKISRKSGLVISATAEELYAVMKGSNDGSTDEEIEKIWEDSWSQLEDPEEFSKLIAQIQESLDDTYGLCIKVEVKDGALE